MTRVAVAGHLCLDLAPRLRGIAAIPPGGLIEVGPLAVELGGCVANTGGVLARLGIEVVPQALIGDDELGLILREKIGERGIDASHLTTIAGATTSYSLVIEPPGVDRTFWHHSGANTRFDGDDIDLDGIALLHLGYPPLLPALLDDRAAPLRRLFSRAREAGVATSLDLAVVDPDSPAGALPWGTILDALAPLTDVLSPSLDDLTSAFRIDEPYSAELVERLASRLVAGGVAVVAISAGEHGLFVRTGPRERFAAPVLAAVAERWSDRAIHVPPALAGPPVTTRGAGDASSAGLLAGLIREWDLEDAARLAASSAAAILSGTPLIE